jgi:uncharacterized membrane protein YoaK (UPF0700 family)
MHNAKSTHTTWLTTALLSFVAGYVDTIGFVALFSLFTAHVTGNFILIGATIASTSQTTQGLTTKLLALPAFIVGVAITTIAIRALQEQHRKAAFWAVVVQIMLTILFMMMGLLAEPITSGDTPLVIATGLVGVCAMAVQNAASRLVFAEMAPSTVMTGNVTQLVIDAVDLIKNKADVDAKALIHQRMRKMLPAVVAFAVGALLAGLGYFYFGFVCLSIVIGVLVLVAILLLRINPN